MSEMLLFGAGASIEAEVPGAYAMTDRILSNLRADARFEKQAHALSYVVGGLLLEAGKNNINPLAPAINVEDLFNAVQLLAERNSLEAAPFIGSWHSFIDELDKIYPTQSSGNLQRLIYEAVSKEILSAFSQSPPSFGASKIDTALAATIKKTIEAAVKNRSVSLSQSDRVGGAIERYVKEVTEKWSRKLKSPSLSGSDKIGRHIDGQIRASQARSGQGRIFHQTNELMVAALKDLAWIQNPNLVLYLAPLLNLVEEQGRLVIATLNYDNSIELLSRSQKMPCQTGITDWSAYGSFDVSGSGLHLLKLHGSIDWHRQDISASENRMPAVAFRQLAPEEVKQLELRPAVIFGNRNKLTAEGPFLDLLKVFQNELSHSHILTIVGYSFRDPHVNVYISQWLNGDSTRVLRIVNGPDFANSALSISNPSSFEGNLLRFRLANPSRVKIVDAYAGEGLRILYGDRQAVMTESTEVTTQPALDRIAQELETEVAGRSQIDDAESDSESIIEIGEDVQP